MPTASPASTTHSSPACSKAASWLGRSPSPRAEALPAEDRCASAPPATHRNPFVAIRILKCFDQRRYRRGFLNRSQGDDRAKPYADVRTLQIGGGNRRWKRAHSQQLLLRGRAGFPIATSKLRLQRPESVRLLQVIQPNRGSGAKLLASVSNDIAPAVLPRVGRRSRPATAPRIGSRAPPSSSDCRPDLRPRCRTPQAEARRLGDP